jgi:hypothetical protein
MLGDIKMKTATKTTGKNVKTVKTVENTSTVNILDQEMNNAKADMQRFGIYLNLDASPKIVAVIAFAMRAKTMKNSQQGPTMMIDLKTVEVNEDNHPRITSVPRFSSIAFNSIAALIKEAGGVVTANQVGKDGVEPNLKDYAWIALAKPFAVIIETRESKGRFYAKEFTKYVPPVQTVNESENLLDIAEAI